MRIGIDLDGVVYDLMTPWLRRYNERYEDTLTREDIIDFNFEGVEFRCDVGDFMSFLYDGRIHLEAEPVPMAVEVITEWASEGHTIVFISATKRPAIWAKVARLAVDFPDVPYELHFTSDKAAVEVDVFIDDHVRNVLDYALLGVNPDAVVLLFDQPWNHDDEIYQAYDVNIGRVLGWDTMREALPSGRITRQQRLDYY